MPIEVKNVSYTYMPGTPFAKTALTDISLTINEGEFWAVAGHTGSGKSTLLQHLNGLIAPTVGDVLIDGVNLKAQNKSQTKAVLAARRKVGMVFQYPERQLFEETVFADIAFGPKTLGLDDQEIESRVKTAMGQVNLAYDDYRDVSPLNLSGGQMRRVAIAGILALTPKYLVLDEPTAGLDPQNTQNLLQEIRRLHKKCGLTIILVSHDMEIIARLADFVAVLKDGRLLLADTTAKVFTTAPIIAQAGLKPPAVMGLLQKLRQAGLNVDTTALTLEQGVKSIAAALRAESNKRSGRTTERGKNMRGAL